MNIAKRFNPGKSASPLVAAAAYATLLAVLLASTAFSINGLLDQKAGTDGARDMLSRMAAGGPVAARTVTGDGPSGSSYFLEGATVTVAGAALLQHVVAVVTRYGGAVVSSQVDIQGPLAKDGFLAATLNCELDQPALQQVLYELESGMPFLFVDKFDVQAVGGARNTGAGKLRLQLTVSGQWKGAR